MGPLNSCVRDCVSVNLFAMRYQQMESMFRSDLNEPMISSKVAILVEDQRALLHIEIP